VRWLFLAVFVALVRTFTACEPTVGPGGNCSPGWGYDPHCPAGYTCFDTSWTCERECSCGPDGRTNDADPSSCTNFCPEEPTWPPLPTAKDAGATDTDASANASDAAPE
jgi:hypothetical protein